MRSCRSGETRHMTLFPRAEAKTNGEMPKQWGNTTDFTLRLCNDPWNLREGGEEERSVWQNRSARGQTCTEAIYYSAWLTISEHNNTQQRRGRARSGIFNFCSYLTLFTQVLLSFEFWYIKLKWIEWGVCAHLMNSDGMTEWYVPIYSLGYLSLTISWKITDVIVFT